MPKPFRLQALLEHKEHLEQQQTLVLAGHDAARRRACDVLDTLREAEAEHLHHLDTLARSARIDAPQQRDAISYLGRIEASIALQRAVIAEAEARVQESRDVLLEILKEKRALERLREQHAIDDAREEGRREALEVDESTSARYTRGLQKGA